MILFLLFNAKKNFLKNQEVYKYSAFKNYFFKALIPISYNAKLSKSAFSPIT